VTNDPLASVAPEAEGDAALELLRAELRRLGRSAKTIQALTGTARRFVTWLGGRALAQVTRSDLERYLAGRRAGGLAALSQAAEASRLRAFFRVLVDRGALVADPSADLAPIRARARAKRAMKTSDVEALLRAASAPRGRNLGVSGQVRDLRDRALLELLYAAGLRACEAVAAQVTDLDLAGAAFLVRAAKHGPPRHVPLPSATLPHLRRYLREARPLLTAAPTARHEGRLLLTREGRPLRHLVVYEAVVGAARRAGLDASPHALRRALATHLVRAGASLPAVQRLLGHARLTTTAIYVSLESEDLRGAVEVLDLSE